jgi:transcription initiation factor TFIIIB Brf1 subunit/transcription initiation factor TFIIB
MALSETELFNPHSSRATARQIDMETTFQSQRENIDLEIYGQEQADLLAFRQAQRELELAYQAERQALEMELARTRSTTLVVAGCAAIVLAGGGVAIYLASLARRNQNSNADQEKIEELRRTVRRLSHANEQLLRRQIYYEQRIHEVSAQHGNGKQRAVRR